MERKITKQRRKLVQRYIKSEETDETVLDELNRLCIPIYMYIYRGFSIKLPHLDKEDYKLMGYITLWKVLEKCRERPELIDCFDAYLFKSVRNTYAAEFRKYVFKNAIELRSYENREGDYNISEMMVLTGYIEKERKKHLEAQLKYEKNHKDKKKAKDRRYYERHREEILERTKRYQEEHKDEIRARMSKYYKEHREQENARHRKYYHDHLEQCRAQRREYRRKRKKQMEDEREASKNGL